MLWIILWAWLGFNVAFVLVMWFSAVGDGEDDGVHDGGRHHSGEHSGRE